MKAKCAVVPKATGEFIRKKLSDDGMLRKDLRIKSTGEFLLMPLNDGAGPLDELGLKISEDDFEEQAQTVGYQEIVEVPDELRGMLPSSYDIVGSIAVLKLKEELVPYRKSIAQSIIEANKAVKTVLLDKGVGGELRIRDVEVIAGEDTTVVTHREFGIQLEIDLAGIYFSPRLSAERKRIADQVQDGERIIDMFAGAGPFSIMIGKLANPERIDAIDLNPTAIEYLKRNIERNRIESVRAYSGDARDVVPSLGKADRVIMNLPHSSFEFLDVALGALEKGVINYYEILDNSDVDERKKRIAAAAEAMGYRAEISSVREVHTYSPTQNYFCFDINVEKQGFHE